MPYVHEEFTHSSGDELEERLGHEPTVNFDDSILIDPIKFIDQEFKEDIEEMKEVEGEYAIEITNSEQEDILTHKALMELATPPN